MKKFCCFLLSAAVLLFCGCQVTPNTPYEAVNISYEYICALENFACYASYHDRVVLLKGDAAKQMYKVVAESVADLEHTQTSLEGDHVDLIFYDGTADDPFSDQTKITDFYGCYSVYADGSVAFTGSPYHSAVVSYPLETSIFPTVLEKTFP